MTPGFTRSPTGTPSVTFVYQPWKTQPSITGDSITIVSFVT